MQIENTYRARICQNSLQPIDNLIYNRYSFHMIHNNLKQIRISLGYSQEQMAGLLGVSRPTYADIEKGRGEITISSLKKLTEKSGVSLSSLLAGEEMVAEAKNQEALTKYKKMLLYMLRCGADTDGKITKTKLAKLLYLVDFAWFYKHLSPMSGLTYRRIKYGPVPDQYFRALEELVDENQIQISSGNAHMVWAVEKNPPLRGLTDGELDLIKQVCRKWKGKNTSDIVEFTHSQLPWKLCKENELIPYELIIQEDPADVY